MEKSSKMDRDIPHRENNAGKDPSIWLATIEREKRTEERKEG